MPDILGAWCLVNWVLGKLFLPNPGWSGGARVLGKLPVPGRTTIWIIVGQGPIALAVGAGGGRLDIFTLLCSPLSPSFWETARYRLKYCLKGPLNPKSTNQPNPTKSFSARVPAYFDNSRAGACHACDGCGGVI